MWISLSYKLISHIRCVWIDLTSCEKISLTSGGRVGAGVGRRSKERCCIDRRHSCRDETVQNSVYKHGASPLLLLSSPRCGLKSTDSGNILAGIREIGLWEKFRELSWDVGVGEEG